MKCCINKTNATPMDEEPTAPPTEFEIKTFPTMMTEICTGCDNFGRCIRINQSGATILCTAIVSVPSGYVRKDKNR